MEQKHFRKNYFIKKNFQGKYIFSYFIFALVGSTIFALVLAYFSSDALTITYENSDLTFGKTSDVLLKSFLTFHWISFVLVGILVVLGALILTHRVAGPLYKFEETFDAMLAGDLSARLILRKNDEGQELAEKINRFNERLTGNIIKADTLSRKMDDRLNSLTLGKIQDHQKLLSELIALTEINKEMSENLSHFKIPENND